MSTPLSLHRLSQSETCNVELCSALLDEHKSNDLNVITQILPNKQPIMVDHESPSTDSVIDIIIDDNESFSALLYKLTDSDYDTTLTDNGYIKINKICNTLQGDLFKAKRVSNNKYVAIKRADKLQFNQQIAIQDDISFCVSENIIKEAVILKYLTIDNQCLGDYIVKFIDFFESDTDYFLVMEYIESAMNLKQFIRIAHKYIKNGKLKLKQYQKIIKYILWQISVTLCWVHDDMKCCHLDVTLENIMLQNCDFIKQNDGYFMINPNISIKLCDFGVSEVFDRFPGSFDCRKQGLSLDNESYLAPKIGSDDIYDARLADTWSLGMILFECMTGRPLFKPIESCRSLSPYSLFNGYTSLYQRKLGQYISMINKPIKYFNSTSFALLTNLLNIDERKRLNAMNVLKHKWFESYYKKYHKRIKNQSVVQKRKLLKTQNVNLPFYKLIEY